MTNANLEVLKYFKRPGSQELYAYTQNQIDSGCAEGATEATAEEADAFLNPAPTYQQLLIGINAAYQSDVDKFNRLFAIAYLSDGPSQEAKQASIRSQYEIRKSKYAADVAALKSQFGIGV